MSESKQNFACPDAATLRALLDGTLPDEQQLATQAHVDRCSTCEAALRQMTAGGESWIGIAEKLKGSGEDDPKLTAALERLKADDGSGGESSEPANDPQRTLDFLQPADDPKLLGKLGQHEISEVVGWGGMGVVLKAYDPSLHRVVAVKVLASHLAHHAVARKRFIREAQAAAAVCHDNVVTIHAIDESGSQPKIVMQFVAGGSLQERIDQEAPLELKEILRIALQTAAGLAAAHAQGVVHRDVKPANILLENGVQRVKLTDFGLARVMDDASLTLSGVIAGTPQYMAPEQAWGREVDARADLFSLGAVMYAMCSGHSPFRARTTMAVLKRVCEDAPRPLRAINPDIPDWLVAIIEKLLVKNPNERFQSATEVSELLGRWLAHAQQPTVVPAPPRVQSSSRRVPFQSQAASEPLTASGNISPGAIPSLSNKESVFLVLAMVGACVPFAGLVMFHFMTFPPPAPPLDPGLRYLVLAMFWGQFLTLVVTTAINFHRKSLGVIPTILQCSALCLTIYFIPVAIMGFRLLGKRMKSDAPVDENSARRGSPDPAASPDRRSPEFIRGQNSDEDLRSNPSVELGDSRTAEANGDLRTVRGQIPERFVLWPLVVMLVLLGLMLVLVVGEGGARNIASFLGFSAFQLLATFVLASVFRAAWNSSRWVVWIASLLFLPFIASLFGYAATFRDPVGLVQWMSALQALTAMAYWLGLMFVRPLFVHESDPRLAARPFSWQRVLALTCLLLVPVSMWVVWRMRVGEDRIQQALEAARLATLNREGATVVVPVDRDPRKPQLDDRGFPNAQLLSNRAPSNSQSEPMSPALDSTSTFAEPAGSISQPAAASRDSFKPLLGRWVVLSLQGDEPPFASAAAGGMGGASGFGGTPGATTVTPTTTDQLRSLEFRDGKLFLNDPVDESLGAEVRNDRALLLQNLSTGESVRHGVFTIADDRLVICWTSPNHPLPRGFQPNPHEQLVVCRREWSRPSQTDEKGNAATLKFDENSKLPKAEMPFSSREAAELQSAWAEKSKSPVEVTNTVGMKLRVIPPGSFGDPRVATPGRSMGGASGGFGTSGEGLTGGGGAYDASMGMPMGGSPRSGERGYAAVSGPILVGAHEVTVAQFRQFVEDSKYVTEAERSENGQPAKPHSWRKPEIEQDSDQHPVVNVTFEDALAFCHWLSLKEKKPYRLLTRREWEFCARAGSWLPATLGPGKLPYRSQFFTTTAPVGSYTANSFGLHDFIGNVAEWAWDGELSRDDSRRRPAPGSGNAIIGDDPMIFCGGDFRQHINRSQPNEWLHPNSTTTLPTVGFRVACELTTESVMQLPMGLSAATGLMISQDIVRLRHLTAPADDKPADAKPDPEKDSAAKPREELRHVVWLEILMFPSRMPHVVEWLDFEVQRRTVQEGEIADEDHLRRVLNSDENWKPVALDDAIRLLNQVENATDDIVPSGFKDPVITMPIPKTVAGHWIPNPKFHWTTRENGSDLILKGPLATMPTFNRPQLFRFLDFHAPHGTHNYRVRLKYRIPGITPETVQTTSWFLTMDKAVINFDALDPRKPPENIPVIELKPPPVD